MKYARIVVSRYGGPEELRLVEEDRREPQAGEVRVKVLAAGVSLPDLVAREGVHPETPKVPFTPGWDLVGVVDALGAGVTGVEAGQIVAAMPISGAYAEYVWLRPEQIVPVPAGLDAAETVSLILNYITAYQMMHRSVTLSAGDRVLIHGASGGVGTALLQLGSLAGLEMYGTCSKATFELVRRLRGIPIDYKAQDFVEEVRRLTGDGVHVVFDSIGGAHIWRSRKALRRGGRVVAYGVTSTLKEGRLATGKTRSKRDRFYAIRNFAPYVIGSWLMPGNKRVVPYSIQTLMRVKPAQFREDLMTLIELLRLRKIEPLIAQRLPLAEARAAHEILGRGGVAGKIVLMCDPGTRTDT